jgi:beta-xylosidase
MNAHRQATPGDTTVTGGPPPDAAYGSALPADLAAGTPSDLDTGERQPWRDPALPVPERVRDLISRMTLAEKLAQLSAAWLADPSDGGQVAPLQGDFTDGSQLFDETIRDGLGQLTRVFGSHPVTPAGGIRALAALQAQICAASRFGIPAIVHEECLTGVMAWSATVFPVPTAWGASFNPGLVEEMAAAIGRSMRALGAHQGLAPVFDVARDGRWGRIEETIGEDPYLVGTIGTAYVRGLQSTGVVATLKHFAAYPASRAGRNMAPVSVGPREMADVFLPPFEMAIREGRAGSVMPSYAAIDGVPAHADRVLLTEVLRNQLGFQGVVVSDYFGISFLETLHGVAASPPDAGAIALRAGVDMELPNVRCYGAGLADKVRAGQVPEDLVDRSATRILRQKFELGLLDPAPDGIIPPQASTAGGSGGVVPPQTSTEIDLNPPEHRALARRLAEESVVLLANDSGVLPLRPDARLAVIGPLANDPLAFFGGYTFPRHLDGLASRDGTAGDEPGASGIGLAVQTAAEALRAEFPYAAMEFAPGCEVRSLDRSGIAAAVDCARNADVVIAFLGDEAGHFGRGSSGEGCDAGDLSLPGVQGDLLADLVATGKPVVLMLVTGRPYAIGPAAGQLAAALQAYFPGQEGGPAVAGVLSGRVVPSGKLPIELPALAGSQPSGYLASRLAARTDISSVDPTPLFPFGHGLSYTSFEYTDLTIQSTGGESETPGAAGGGAARIATAGAAEIGCTVRNTGRRAGDEVVQLYLSDPVAQVARPVSYLAGFARVALQPGQARRVLFRLHADRTAFAGVDGGLVVEPGVIEVAVGSSSQDLRLHGSLELEGPERSVGPDRALTTPVAVRDVA